MKAIMCHEFAPIDALTYEEVPDPTPNEYEIIIVVAACGINFPDGLLVQGLYQMKPEHPFSPGSEVTGTISQLGAKVKHLKLGQRVIGLTMTGGYAQKVAINSRMVLPLPDTISFEQGAGLITAHATAHHGLKQRANLKKGETLLVTGASGGTGLAAVQIGKAMGAKVIALCSSQEKLFAAKEQGADELLLSSDPDLKDKIKALTANKGVDVVYEVVGGDIFQTCARTMAWNGRLLVVGFASGSIPEFPVNLALVKGFSVIGVFWGSFAQKEPANFMVNMQELLAWYEQGQVKVVIDQVYPLSQAPEALSKVFNRQSIGKLILTP
ncbi:oxidoreductase, zinc-binding [Marinomonas sp. MED121]|uniref:NADPH:quinone oxidoreductase family protein n=1 Tax=Marinomonas sp. MED121 TaxID=314277 RepID=UPI000069082F|nr:NADPH:quinone oxidoreductase family protein [Marinomonas sp. MED121]EAQ64572.1 oxidoreductase, zinc-binding [Marinomonas sp. MED121]